MRRLRADGRREEAAEVARLRRPTATAWALDQVARREPDLIGRVLDEGARLRAAMERAVGGDASALREAQSAERAAVDAVVAAAAAHLGEHDQAATDAVARRLAGSVRAAVVDDDVADRLRRGVLDRDVEAPGFGLDGLAAAGPTVRAPTRERRPQDPEQREHLRQARARRAELEVEVERRERRLDRLRAAAEEAERRAVEARAAAQQAESDVADARRRLAAAAADAEDPG